MNIDRAKLDSMPLSGLAALYRELTGETVRKFSDKKTAVRRVLAAIDRKDGAARPTEAPASAERGKKNTKARRVPRAHRFTPSGPIKEPRPGSKRALLLTALLGNGLTGEQIESKFAWRPRDCRDALALLAKQNGFVVYLGEDARWHAARPETDRRRSARKHRSK